MISSYVAQFIIMEDFSNVNLMDLSKRLQQLERDHRTLQKTVETLLTANASLEAKNQALERELLQVRTVQNGRAIGTNTALAEIERDMEEVDETFRQIYVALKTVDDRVPLGLDWIKGDLPFKARSTAAAAGGGVKPRSRKGSLQPQPYNGRTVSNSVERPLPLSAEDRLHATEEKLKRLSKGQEVSDKTLADVQKTLADLHVNLRPAQVLARKFVDANGWTEKELAHWRTVLAEGNYSGSNGPPEIPLVKKTGKTVTIQKDAHTSPLAKDPDCSLVHDAAGRSSSRKHIRRKSSSDLLFVPPPGDTRPMSLFYCAIM